MTATGTPMMAPNTRSARYPRLFTISSGLGEAGDDAAGGAGEASFMRRGCVFWMSAAHGRPPRCQLLICRKPVAASYPWAPVAAGVVPWFHLHFTAG